MGKITVFDINLDNELTVLNPGERVTGHVVVDLKEPIETRGLRIKCVGKEFCSWEEERKNYTKVYDNSVSLFKEVECLFGTLPDEDGPKVFLPVGKTTYPFEFLLPSQLPSSFEGKHGHIRYKLRAIIDQSWKFDHRTIRPFVINEIIDTNKPDFWREVTGSEEKNVGCCCWKAGLVEVTAKVERGCYCPGETIFLTAQFQNKTTRNVNIKAKVVQEIEYTSSGKRIKWSFKTLEKTEKEKVRRGGVAEWNNKPIMLPPMPPTIMGECVEVTYHVAVEVEVPCGWNLTAVIPIVIGTVPFRAYAIEPPQQDSGAPDLPPPFTFDHPVGPPPSYASVVGDQPIDIRGKNNYVYGNSSYIPVYPYAQSTIQNYPAPEYSENHRQPLLSGRPPSPVSFVGTQGCQSVQYRK